MNTKRTGTATEFETLIEASFIETLGLGVEVIAAQSSTKETWIEASFIETLGLGVEVIAAQSSTKETWIVCVTYGETRAGFTYEISSDDNFMCFKLHYSNDNRVPSLIVVHFPLSKEGKVVEDIFLERVFDDPFTRWCATYIDTYDGPESPIGTGKTPTEAVEALIEMSGDDR